MSGSAPRRDNGLTATSYVRLRRRRDPPGRRAARPAGATSASPPTAPRRPGRRGPYGDTVPPLGPSDSVYVDSRRSASGPGPSPTLPARDPATSSPGSDIVAGFDTRAGRPDGRCRGGRSARTSTEADGTARPARRPTEHAGHDHRVRGAARPTRPTSPVVRRDAAADDPDDHFQPPPPPPLPEIDRVGRFAWAGARGRSGSSWCWPTLLGLHARRVGRVARAGRLHGRLRHARRPDEGPSARRTPARTTEPSSSRSPERTTTVTQRDRRGTRPPDRLRASCPGCSTTSSSTAATTRSTSSRSARPRPTSPTRGSR